jgi:hypothetical protein
MPKRRYKMCAVRDALGKSNLSSGDIVDAYVRIAALVADNERMKMEIQLYQKNEERLLKTIERWEKNCRLRK